MGFVTRISCDLPGCKVVLDLGETAPPQAEFLIQTIDSQSVKNIFCCVEHMIVYWQQFLQRPDPENII